MPQMQSTGLRKYHTKSRNSCASCRKRRVKCDLQAPICAHCERRGDYCSFRDQHVDCSVMAAPTTTSTHSKAFRFSFFDTSLHSNCHPQSAILISHYLREAAGSLSLVDSLSPLWRHTVPFLAQNHRFLWHGLLSISALHLSHFHPAHKPKYLELAQIQYLEATTTFRVSTSSVSHDNSMAVLVFAILVAIFHFKGSVQKVAAVADNFTEVLEPLLALRGGLRLIRANLKELLKRDDMAQLLEEHTPEPQDRDHDLSKQLDDLEAAIFLTRHSERVRQHCIQAVHVLRQCYHDFGTTPQSWLQLAWWPFEISVEYLNLLLIRHPVALAVFRCWCYFVRNAPSRWFFVGWSDWAIKSTENLVVIASSIPS